MDICCIWCLKWNKSSCNASTAFIYFYNAEYLEMKNTCNLIQHNWFLLTLLCWESILPFVLPYLDNFDNYCWVGFSMKRSLGLEKTVKYSINWINNNFILLKSRNNLFPRNWHRLNLIFYVFRLGRNPVFLSVCEFNVSMRALTTEQTQSEQESYIYKPFQLCLFANRLPSTQRFLRIKKKMSSHAQRYLQGAEKQ